LEEPGQEQVEHDIDKMSNVSARVVLLVSFNVNSFDYLSVKGNLNPVAKYLKRDEIKSEKDISFLFVKENTASSSVKQSILSVNAGHTDESKDLNDSFGFAVSDELTDCS
ncbi:unnamed protein product, partial [Porites evermanni]